MYLEDLPKRKKMQKRQIRSVKMIYHYKQTTFHFDFKFFNLK